MCGGALSMHAHHVRKVIVAKPVVALESKMKHNRRHPIGCPVTLMACPREICIVAGQRTGWDCYIISHEIEKHG